MNDGTHDRPSDGATATIDPAARAPVEVAAPERAAAQSNGTDGRSSGKKPTLAIVSSYDEFCGIAAYTRHLERQLAEHFDVTVIPLDQRILRYETPRRIKLGNEHIARIAASLSKYDYANIQYEPGTLASIPELAYRRMRTLVKGAPSLSVTFHTFLTAGGIPAWPAFRDLCKLRFGAAFEHLAYYRRARSIGDRVFSLLKRESKKRPISFIVHTKREADRLELDFAFDNIFHHPLSFLTEDQIDDALRCQVADISAKLADLPRDTKLIGVFGFIGRYKGTLTAVRALRKLPDNYHLLVFGGLHPNSIRRENELDEYLEEVVNETLGRTQLPSSKPWQSSKVVKDLLYLHSDLSDRVHFMGAMSDREFVRGMAVCDSVVLPYIEVGQTSSGPISMAVELGKHVVASRTHTFRQFARYHKDRINFFEVGNHLELAERLLATRDRPIPDLTHDGHSNAEIYRRAHIGVTQAAAAR